MLESNLLDLEVYNKIRSSTPITSAIVNVTDNCNLRCPYCFTAHNTRRSSLEVLKQTANFLINEVQRTQSQSPISIAFFGGEPMLEFENLIKPFVLWCSEQGFIEKYNLGFSITTNGTLLNEDKIRFLYKYGINPLLSIDGNKFTQDDQRPTQNGQSSFDLIYPNIPILLKYFPNITFRSTLEPRNADKMFENYLFAREQGFKHYFTAINVYGDWKIEDIQKAARSLAAMLKIMEEDIKYNGKCCQIDPIIKELKSTFFKRKEISKVSLTRCGLGTVSMGVACDGSIKGCQEHNTYIDNDKDFFYIGNVFTGIDPRRHRQLLEEYIKYENMVIAEDPKLCESCEIKNQCAENFCPSANFGVTKETSKNPFVSCMWKRYIHALVNIWLQDIKEKGFDPKLEQFFKNVLRG